MAPYIVTVRRPPSGRMRVFRDESRRAVATLDEAREIAEGYVTEKADGEEYNRALDQVEDMPESGGTVGPLPDGTVIEVERREIQSLWPHNTDSMDKSDAEIIAAFNEAQGAPAYERSC